MNKIKKGFAVILSAVASLCFSIDSNIDIEGNALYDNENVWNQGKYNYVVGLDEKPLSCYDEAIKNGVREFILSDEGQEAYMYMMVHHDYIKGEIAEIIGRMPRVKYDYTAAFNGFSVELEYNEVNEVAEYAQQLGIVSIEYGSAYTETDNITKSDTSDKLKSGTYSDMTEKMFDATGINQIEMDGEGTVVAIIDNEVDYAHEFFQLSDGFNGKLSRDDIKSVMPYLSAAPYITNKSYYNEKIPYRFSYDKQNYNTYSENQSHGTHVTGIISGNGEAETLSKYEPKGVAPNAQILLMTTESLATDECLAAYDDVLYLGADVVNASYGYTGATDKSFYAETVAINNIISTGTIFCTAAGNDGKYVVVDNIFTDYSTGGTPDNINKALTVGSADNIAYKDDNKIIILSDGSEERVADGKTNGIVEYFDGQAISYVAVPGYGSNEDYKTIDAEGKIVLIKRGGEITIPQKLKAAENNGAAGALIYNNYDNSEVLEIESDNLPVGMISLAAAKKMIDMSYKTIEFESGVPTIEIDEKANISYYSAWDFTEQLLLKPDITAFGGNIMSSISGDNHDSYALYSGTSMAAPQLTGITSLLIQHMKKYPEKYIIENRADYSKLAAQLLMSTAVPIYSDNDIEIASPRVQGNGLVNIQNAINTPCYISSDSEKDSFRPKISLGDGFKKNYILDFNITNISERDAEYNLSAKAYKDAEDKDGNLEWNTKRLTEGIDYDISFMESNGKELENINISSGETVKVTAELTLSDDIYEEIVKKGGRFIDGFITLTSDVNPDMTLSFMAFCGNWSEVKENDVIFDFIYNNADSEYSSFLCDKADNKAGINLIDMTLSKPAFSPLLNDNVLSDIVLSLCFKRRCYDITAEIYNSDGELVFEEYLAASADRMIYDIGQQVQESNFYSLNWDFTENGIINNNEEYTIEISALLPLSEKSVIIGSQEIIIDTQKPKIKNVGLLEAFGSKYLVIDAEDNYMLHGAACYAEEDDDYIFCQSANASSKKGRIIVEISDASEVKVYDMAGNYTEINTYNTDYSLTLQADNGFGYAASDEKDFFDGKISVIGDTDNAAAIELIGSVTPSEMYEIYNKNSGEVSLLADGVELACFEVNVGLRGDANSDNICNIRDAAYVANMLSKSETEEYDEFMQSIAGYLADFNVDFKTNVRDAAAIASFLAKKH